MFFSKEQVLQPIDLWCHTKLAPFFRTNRTTVIHLSAKYVEIKVYPSLTWSWPSAGAERTQLGNRKRGNAREFHLSSVYITIRIKAGKHIVLPPARQRLTLLQTKLASRTKKCPCSMPPSLRQWKKCSVYISIPLHRNGHILVKRSVLLRKTLLTQARSESLARCVMPHY